MLEKYKFITVENCILDRIENIINTDKTLNYRIKTSCNVFTNCQEGDYLHINVTLPSPRFSEIRFNTRLDEASISILKRAYENLKLTPKDIDNIIKISLAIALIDNSKNIKSEHIAESVNYCIPVIIDN